MSVKEAAVFLWKNWVVTNLPCSSPYMKIKSTTKIKSRSFFGLSPYTHLYKGRMNL